MKIVVDCPLSSGKRIASSFEIRQWHGKDLDPELSWEVEEAWEGNWRGWRG